MRFKLNLNSASGKMLATLAFFLVLGPGVLWAAAQVGVRVGWKTSSLLAGARFSLVIGALLAVGFALLVCVELIQDGIVDRRYRKNLPNKIRLPGGGCECPYCGSRKVRQADRQCPVCGKELLD